MSRAAARTNILGGGRFLWRSLLEPLDSFTSRVSPKQSPAYPRSLQANKACSYSSKAIPAFKRPSLLSLLRSPRPHNYNVRRSFTSGGLLLASFTPASSTTSTVTAIADSAIAGSAIHAGSIAKLSRNAWQKGIHTGRGRIPRVYRRTKTSKSNAGAEKVASASKNDNVQQSPSSAKTEAKPEIQPTESHSPYISKYFQMPTLPHRPTKEDFLAVTTGFWQRLKVRFKWFSIRSMRPWNIDEWGAFVSWFLFGHLVWILVGTTTFFSLLIISINTVVAQGMSNKPSCLTILELMCDRNPR
jgi:mitochondrial distribution and morphology protein 31